ncbi:MAG: DNA polymerase III subunit beta [Gemmatimonadaceae bacterium]|nr:DNA polymerase III subunit beta [Gemmatimonadaceae bacterium]
MSAVAPPDRSVASTDEASPSARPAKSTAGVTIQRSHLADALAAIGPTVATKVALPVLSAIRIAAEERGVRLTATNLDQVVSCFCPADHACAGTAFLVPAKRLAEIVAALPDGPVRLVPSGQSVKVAAGHATFRLNTLSASEFPSNAAFDPKATLVIAAGELVRLAEQVRFAASTEESRPILNGVLLEMGAAALRAVATNGHRLALVEAPRTDSAHDALADLIVPPVALESLKRVFAAEELVTLAVDSEKAPTSLRVFSDRASVATRLIEGPYPGYRQVIPSANDRLVRADRNDLLAALRRVLPLATNATARVRIALAGARLVLRVETPDAGSAEDEVPIQYPDGSNFTFAVNGHYLKEILAHLPPGELSWSFSAPERASLLMPEPLPAGSTAQQFVLMPVRLE